MNVLFVCTGNTCRSPMAEAIFNHLAKGYDGKHQAFSRGINVFFEDVLNTKAKKALENMQICDFSHFSKQICEEDVNNADLILTMTSSHKMMIKSMYPKCDKKVFTLCEKAYGKDRDIADPYGQSEDVYILCAKEIEEAVVKLLEKL